MSGADRFLMPVSGDQAKAELDNQTSYTTFLPHMDEGFHVGYQSTPGVECDRNQRPREWLENLARFMCTQGEDVGFSIPDVLASEQQLRRLSRLPHEVQQRHQEMIDYRAVLAMLLLWDGWEQDETWPQLRLVRADAEGADFTRSVMDALSPARAGEGLTLFTLERVTGSLPQQRPLCLLSRAMIVMPAADLGDLSDLLPACVRWYDRAHKRFTDPCQCLTQPEALRLTAQLRLLQALNERPELQSPLYTPQAHLCALLARFISDIDARRDTWRERLQCGDAETQNELRTRVLAVCGLSDSARVVSRVLKPTAGELCQNPLIQQCLSPDLLQPDDLPQAELTLYLLGDTPIARTSEFCALEPTDCDGEARALSDAAHEIDLLSQLQPGWNAAVADKLDSFCASVRGHVGFSSQALALMARWASELRAVPVGADRSIELDYPLEDRSAAVQGLLSDMLGLTDSECVSAPFSDCLLLIPSPDSLPYENAPLAHYCLVEEKPSAPARYAVPPLSPALCEWLIKQGERDEPGAPRLRASGFRFVYDETENAITASFRITARTRSAQSATQNAVTFRRVYKQRERMETGAAYTLQAQTLPYVAVWPNVRFAKGLWKRYFVYAHRPDALDVWVYGADGWRQGVQRRAMDEGARRQSRERVWLTAHTECFPAYVALKRGPLTLGALVGDRPRQQLKLEDPALIGVDFGSISTSVMMRQGERIQPATLPRCLHQALLCANEDDERYLTDELLPKTALLPSVVSDGSSFYSVMDMFTDDFEAWSEPLIDGHIYYRENLASLMRKSENTLYYDMKWSEEPYVLRCIRLLLGQVMLQASLSARLWGSPSLSWRVSMPNALPAHRQEAYLELMRGLAREVAASTGMPLSTSCPAVLYATENQADGLYFRSRNEVSAQNGYLNLDIGGSTTDLSLWLSGAKHATAECSLLLGCRQMLFDSISLWHTEDFAQDFAQADASAREAAGEIVRAMGESAGTTRARQKSMFLLDDFFAECAHGIREAMAAKRATGSVSYVECLLLFNIGFLFCLSGELMQRAWQEEELKPALPRRIELCIAGNGGQLLKAFTDEQREKLCRISLSMLSADHPLRGLLPVQSADPKREVAIGLLRDDELQSSVTLCDRWNGTSDGTEGTDNNLLTRYLPLFAAQFPQAVKRLAPQCMDGSRLSKDTLIELSTIFENERQRTPEDDMAMYVRCFTGLKRLWHI